jgi:hypothetical protein
MAGKESGNAVSNALKNCGDNGIVDEPICIIGKHINSLNTFYGKIGECLKAYVKRYQDDRDAAEALMPIAKILIIKLMPSAADSDNKAVMRIRDNIIGIYNSYCNNKQIGTLGGELSDTYIVEHFAKAENLAAPYHWNAVAAILAYNRKYAAAINILDSWLARYRGGLSSNAHSAEAREQLMEVYEIRVRSMIAGYIYEWLNSEPNVKTKALLDYHANNLNSAIKILQESITNIISPWSGATSENISVNRICDGGHFLREFKWRITVVDQLGPESRKYVGVNQLNVWRMALSYTSTLISLKQTWIDVVLSSEDYQNLYAFDAQKYANELKEIDTDCMKVINPVDGSNGEYYANLLKAENLYWYARVTRANALAPNEPDMRRERLQDALGAAREGLARIAWRAEQQRLERREDRRKAEPCYDRVTAADASANGNEAVRMAHSKLRTPIAEAVSKECRNEFAFKISGTEEIRDVERLSEIIRQLNADLN